jgi:hypothetical protein
VRDEPLSLELVSHIGRRQNKPLSVIHARKYILVAKEEDGKL